MSENARDFEIISKLERMKEQNTGRDSAIINRYALLAVADLRRRDSKNIDFLADYDFSSKPLRFMV